VDVIVTDIPEGDPRPTDVTEQERADSRKWEEAIKAARKFDEPARREYARNRKYARGDSGYELDANIANTYIGILVAFLFAKNPDLDIMPAKCTEPPDDDAIREAALASIPPEVQQQSQLAGMVAAQGPIPTGDPAIPVAQVDPAAASQAVIDQYVDETIKTIRDRFQKRQRDNKAFAETLELVCSRMWLTARVKSPAKKWVRSALTVGLGVMKASWQERTAPDPEMARQIHDLQDNIKRVTQLRLDLAEGASLDSEADTAEYERQLTALQGKAERVIARGFTVDFINAEDWQGALGHTISDNQEMPWQAQRIFMLKEDAKAEFGLSTERINGATTYTPRAPCIQQPDVTNVSGALAGDMNAQDADSFTSGYASAAKTDAMSGGGDGGSYVAVWEIWDRGSNSVLTRIEGVAGWVKAPFQPCATTRFFPFFLFTISDVDGQRHPQSLITSSYKQLDEYNRIQTAAAKHRKRVIPKTFFDKAQIDPKDARALAKGDVGEMVGISRTQINDGNLESMFAKVAYPAFDFAIYDVSGVRNEIEMNWGVQEALAGGVTNDKTATEAEIQQAGFQARTGGRRDDMEEALNELALYTAEIARCYMATEDVTAIVGPDAFWPEYSGAESLAEMVNVEIRAGSSGKPNTNRDKESWSGVLPFLQQQITAVGTLRQSTPEAIADSLERLTQITMEKYGERLDVSELLPPPGPVQQPMPGEPAQPGAANAEPPA
jgi:hypothetical protein